MMTTKLRTLFAVLMAALLVQCQDSSDGSGGGPSEPTDPIEALIAAVQAAPTKVVLIDAEETKKLQESMKGEGIDFDLLQRRRNPQYHLNQVIPRLREANSIWLAYDQDDKGTVATLESFLIKDHKVEVRRTFDHLLLLKIVNEFPDDMKRNQRLTLEKIGEKQGSTTNLVFTPDGSTLLTTAKHGAISHISMDSKHNGVVLRLPSFRNAEEGVYTGGESGLVGLVLSPDFDANPKMYTYYNWKYEDGSRNGIISEWDVELTEGGKKIRARNERQILKIPQHQDTHNAGQMVFGPDDGYLYIAVGDGSIGSQKERAPSHLMRGKILRIDVNSRTDGKEYGIPEDNPFVGNDDFPPETWAWGFRNPWRMSFTPDGRLLAGDIGEDFHEELTFVRKGKHHGWPFIEGTNVRFPWGFDDSLLEPPVLAYGRDLGMSVIAGYVYTSDEIEWLTGKYVFADYLSGRIWAVDLPALEETRSIPVMEVMELGRWPILFTTFGQDPKGNLYVSDPTGQIYRIKESDGSHSDADIGMTENMDPAIMRGMFETELEVKARQDIDPKEVALGEVLYQDARLSQHGDVSCATCHSLDTYGQDNLVRSKGTGGQETRRNTPTTLNAHRQFTQFWDCRSDSPEKAVIESFVSKHGMKNEQALTKTLRGIPEYKQLFADAYPGQKGKVNAQLASRALGAYLRQLTTRSRWDDFLDGDDDALNAQEKRGLSLFISVGCVSCHRYRAVGGATSHKLGLMTPWEGDDEGMAEVSGEKGQRFYFKVANLLNVEKTAPYFHDGSEESLAEAVDFMAEMQLNVQLTGDQTGAIVAFLNSLTGEMQ